MVEVGSGYDIPGEAGRYTCFETRGIVDEVGNNHFKKFVGKSVHLSFHRWNSASQKPECGCAIDCGPVPNDAGNDLGSYDMLTIEHKNQGDQGER